jgi:hypothetical protein
MHNHSLKSNDLCKKLNEESHHHATIPDSMRYTAHFQYEDLVQRLLRVKENSEQLYLRDSSIKKELKEDTSLEFLHKKRSKRAKKILKEALSDRVLTKKQKFVLPLIKSPKPKVKNKEFPYETSVDASRKYKLEYNYKLKPLKQTKRKLLEF